MHINRRLFPIPSRFFAYSIWMAITIASRPIAAATIEQRAPCLTPNYITQDVTYGPADYDIGYAPSFVGTRVSQDSKSRFITGTIRWDRPEYLRYFKEQTQLSGPSGFEIEAHFYNYTDAAQLGWGPSYLLYLACDPAAIASGFTCSVAAQSFAACDIPECYNDTQVYSAKNSLNEYSQPNIAFGSGNASMLNAGTTYFYKARAMSGRGNKSKIKINFQPTRRFLALPVLDKLNQFACDIPGAANKGDAEIVPFDIGAFAPVCMSSTYKHGGILRSILFCNP